MFVRWKKRRRVGAGNFWTKAREYTIWTAQLVESVRIGADAQPRQRILATLASIDPEGEQAQHPVLRLSFWNQVDKRLAALPRLTRAERKAIEAKLAEVVTRPTRAEVRTIAPDVMKLVVQHEAEVVPNITPAWRRGGLTKQPA